MIGVEELYSQRKGEFEVRGAWTMASPVVGLILLLSCVCLPNSDICESKNWFYSRHSVFYPLYPCQAGVYPPRKGDN